MKWFRRSAANSAIEPEVGPLSPARLLAESLLDPETRDEWQRSPGKNLKGLGFSYIYSNKTRSLELKRWLVVSYVHTQSGVNTPFTLSEAEQRIVTDALSQYDKRLADEKEKAALVRLIGEPVKAGGKR
jgi:hypothetical protein